MISARRLYSPVHRSGLVLRGLSGLLLLLASFFAGCSGPAADGPPDPKPGAAAGNFSNPQPAGGNESQKKKPKPQPPKAKKIPDELPGPKVTTAPQPVSPEDLADGWIALFDGQTLFGWRAESEADWRVEDGAIVVESGKPGLLRTTSAFSEYVLRLEFRAAAKTNSGIFLQTPAKPTAPDKDCYELNIAPPDNPFPTGSLVARQKATPKLDPEKWNAYEVTVQSPTVTVRLNGSEVLRYTDPQPLKRGHIGLQLNEGRVEFRNIRLQPLGLKPLLNGKDLAGWKASDGASKFTVTAEGVLEVRDGPGHLESEARFADFVLQAECRTNAPNLNSGIFFRSIPGSKMDGYESQIHNGYHHQDRRIPMDQGSGAIFRRQPARLVVADDQKWLHKTIIAHGPHMAVWINGYQVTDFTDTRAPNDNPRRGLRTAAGTLMLQGHDPTTDLQFRNLRAAELAK